MLRTFTSVTAAAILAVSAPASALTVIDLAGTVVAGEFEGTQGTGQLTFDETVLQGLEENGGSDFPFLSPEVDPMFALTFTIFGQTFTEEDDIFAPDAGPTAFFLDDGFDGVLFQVSEQQIFDEGVVTEIDQEGVSDITIFPTFFFDFLEEGFLFGTVSEGDVIGLQETEPFEVAIAINNGFGVVPLPATLPMLLGALALGGVALRRRKAA